MILPPEPPVCSVIVANHNAGPYLAAALGSLLSQTLAKIEIIIADDGSSDESLAIARQAVLSDPRVSLLESTAQTGPGEARNRAIAASRGTWLAIMDSDDIIHPDRLHTLISYAEENRIDIVADDLMLFYENDDPPTFHLGKTLVEPTAIDLETFIRANNFYSRTPALGYLKPVIRRRLLGDNEISYDPRLRIAEDYDLLLRLIAAGGKFTILPERMYFYRRHSRSTSHRLRHSDLMAMLTADAEFKFGLKNATPGVLQALEARKDSIERALCFDRMVMLIKAGEWQAAFGEATSNPGAAALLRLPVLARLRRFAALPRRRLKRPDPARHGVHVLSRNRVVGSESGSSAYLLSICQAAKSAGHELHLTFPSTAMFGRTPFLRLRPEMAMFTSIRFRDCWQMGSLVVTRDLGVWIKAIKGAVDPVLRRIGVRIEGLSKKAPYSVMVVWKPEDYLFVADRVRGNATVLLADYAFLTEGFPYALSPAARRVVVMHDLFSGRSAMFERQGLPDPERVITLEEETRRLGMAELVLAIQNEEAEAVRPQLPRTAVVVAPMAVPIVAAPRPGLDDTLLFVASNTAANVEGLKWFVANVLPTVRAARPAARLDVVGTVARGFSAKDSEAAEGVSFHGLVPDLEPYYRDAGVVISPLQMGSGLKIKLVEALANGKAIVATTTTLQGVEDICRPYVVPIDDALLFAQEVTALLSNAPLRARRAEMALDLAHRHFSAAACYGPMLDFISTGSTVQRLADVPAAPLCQATL